MYFSFDPRITIRNSICSLRDCNNDGVDEYVFTTTNDIDTVYIPLLLPEETRGQNPYPMPFVEMLLVNSPSKVHNVQGDIREQDAYIDFNIWYTNDDNISCATFGKRIADQIVNQIMTYRHSVTSVSWMEVLNDGREMIEDNGKTVWFHRVVEVYAKNWAQNT